MKIDEYFGQAKSYFSESEGRMIPLDEMVIPHLFYAWRKLKEEEPQFIGTPLYQAMFAILTPEPTRMRAAWVRHGKAFHLSEPWYRVKAVRQKMYRAAKYAGFKITTHNDERGFMTAELIHVPFKVTVNKVAH